MKSKKSSIRAEISSEPMKKRLFIDYIVQMVSWKQHKNHKCVALYFQSVSKVFEQIVNAIERAGGNVPEKSGCTVS